MKKKLKIRIIITSVVIFSLISFYSISQSNGTLTFTVTTSTAPATGDINNYYAPKHVLAIWIADANGNWVKTRKLRAAVRKDYLYTFKSKCPTFNIVDATSGATLTNHTTHTVTWDGKDVNGNLVPDGNYRVYIEFTEEHMQGPIYYLSFTKGPTAQHLTPTNQSYFKNISLDWVSTAGISEQIKEESNILICEPNPITNFTNIKYHIPIASNIKLQVFNGSGTIIQTLFDGHVSAGEHTFYWEVNNQKFSTGIYFLGISFGNKTSIIKIVKLN